MFTILHPSFISFSLFFIMAGLGFISSRENFYISFPFLISPYNYTLCILSISPQGRIKHLSAAYAPSSHTLVTTMFYKQFFKKRYDFLPPYIHLNCAMYTIPMYILHVSYIIYIYDGKISITRAESSFIHIKKLFY